MWREADQEHLGFCLRERGLPVPSSGLPFLPPPPSRSGALGLRPEQSKGALRTEAVTARGRRPVDDDHADRPQYGIAGPFPWPPPPPPA